MCEAIEELGVAAVLDVRFWHFRDMRGFVRVVRIVLYSGM
jgi:hypothetical protein